MVEVCRTFASLAAAWKKFIVPNFDECIMVVHVHHHNVFGECIVVLQARHALSSISPELTDWDSLPSKGAQPAIDIHRISWQVPRGLWVLWSVQEALVGVIIDSARVFGPFQIKNAGDRRPAQNPSRNLHKAPHASCCLLFSGRWQGFHPSQMGSGCPTWRT